MPENRTQMHRAALPISVFGHRIFVLALLTEETVGWATVARNGFPLPFGRGEGQGEGIHESEKTGRNFPLTPALSPSEGERENRTTTTGFRRPFPRPLSK